MIGKKDWQITWHICNQPITLEDSSTSSDEDGQAVHSEYYAKQIGKTKTGTNPRPSNR
jgi:hypothetical protein